jgi:hypothetical protein
MDSFSSSAFHGLRVGPPCGRAAPPGATFRSPVGAETAILWPGTLNHGETWGCYAGNNMGSVCSVEKPPEPETQEDHQVVGQYPQECFAVLAVNAASPQRRVEVSFDH